MSVCSFHETGTKDVFVCRRCGATITTTVLPIHRICDAPAGFGDTLARWIKRYLGVKPCAKCRKRKELLNRIFPYRK